MNCMSPSLNIIQPTEVDTRTPALSHLYIWNNPCHLAMYLKVRAFPFILLPIRRRLCRGRTHYHGSRDVPATVYYVISFSLDLK